MHLQASVESWTIVIDIGDVNTLPAIENKTKKGM